MSNTTDDDSSLDSKTITRPELIVGLQSQPTFRSAPKTSATFDFPEAPIYIAKYTSFLCPSEISKTPIKVLGSLCTYFEESDNIDYCFKKKSKKIKGVAYINGEPVSFKVCLWIKNGHDLLIEVQRRCGDAIAFNQFYTQLRNDLECLWKSQSSSQVSYWLSQNQNQAMITSNIPQTRSSGRSALDMIEINSEVSDMLEPNDANLCNKNNVNLDDTTLSTLCSMVCQEIGPCKYDAARILANLSSNTNNQATLASFSTDQGVEFIHIVKQLLQAPDAEISRCGSTLAANLAHDMGVRPILLETLLESLIHSIQSPELCLIDRERKRQSARALSLLSESHAVQMRSAAGRLGRCSNSTTDQRLQTTLNTVLRRIM